MGHLKTMVPLYKPPWEKILFQIRSEIEMARGLIFLTKRKIEGLSDLLSTAKELIRGQCSKLC